MFQKFQFKFLLNAILAVGILCGFSHQMVAQVSGHHHSDCGHEHHHQDEVPDSDNSELPLNSQSGDCSCIACGVSFTTQLVAPIASRMPTFSLSEIAEPIVSLYSPPFAVGIDRPPRG